MKIALLSVLFLSLSAFAVDTSRCPFQIEMECNVIKVHKNSRYSNVPGWKDAQQNLLANTVWKSDFRLLSKTSTSCKYKDFRGNIATLSTAEFMDPEENGPVKNDQFTVNYKVNESNFVTFIPVKAYDQNGITTYSKPFDLKVKARLKTSQTRTSNIDMGMLSVLAE